MGSLNDWQNLWKAEYNDALENATIHYNYGVHVHSYTESITKQPTCTEEGEKTFTCDCGDTYTEIIPAKGHTEIIDKAVPATCTTDGKTEGSHCYVCGEVIKAQTVIKAMGHNFGSWSTTKAATCTESGTQTRKCSVLRQDRNQNHSRQRSHLQQLDNRQTARGRRERLEAQRVYGMPCKA